MDLDLGEKAVCNITIAGDKYKVEAPTVQQSESYQNKIKVDGISSISEFVDLLSELGLPKKVSQSLDILQMQKLAEGVLGLVEKK